MYNRAHVMQHFSRAAAQYDAHAQLQHHVARQAASMLPPHVNSAASMLDLGCGTGYAAASLRVVAPQANIMGVDIAPAMCKQASRHFSAVCASADQLPFSAESFDAVFSSLMLQWASDVEAIFAEIRRVLVPRGVAMITTFGEHTLWEMKKVFEAAESLPRTSDFLPLNTLLSKASRQGFHCIQQCSHRYTQHHENFFQLMRSLKNIGANNKRLDAKKSMTNRRFFAEASARYAERYEHANVIPSAWHVHYLLLEKQ